MPVGRYLGVLAGIFVVLYALVFFAGATSSTPSRSSASTSIGGTQVTLQAQTTDSKPPSSADDSSRPAQIIERRVNGLGVAEAEVVIEGNRNDRHLGARRER